MSEERSIRDYAVVGIRTMSEDVRQQFLERLRQEQRAWDFKSNPRIPIDVFPDAFSHFYSLRFLRPLLSGAIKKGNFYRNRHTWPLKHHQWYAII